MKIYPLPQMLLERATPDANQGPRKFIAPRGVVLFVNILSLYSFPRDSCLITSINNFFHSWASLYKLERIKVRSSK